MSQEAPANPPIRLTQDSHGKGCGCKIGPKVLDVILAGSGAQHLDARLWVGNTSRDDAAVYALDDERGVMASTRLAEMPEGSGLTAVIQGNAVPRIEGVNHYIAQGCVPGGTQRNFDSDGEFLDVALSLGLALLPIGHFTARQRFAVELS